MSPIGKRNSEWIVWPPTFRAATPVGARSTRDEQVLARALDAVEDGLLLGGEGYAHGASVPSRFRPPILREAPA
jgi:hypothetical protein